MRNRNNFEIGDIVAFKSDSDKKLIIASVAQDWNYDLSRFNGFLYNLKETNILNDEIDSKNICDDLLDIVANNRYYKAVYHGEDKLVLIRKASVEELEKMYEFLQKEIESNKLKLKEFDSRIKNLNSNKNK